MPHTRDEAPVVICGGGPVGLAMSIELAHYGVGSIVLERHPGTAVHPRARNINTRTMEIIRGWDAQAQREMRALNLPRGWTDQIVYTRTLGGEEFGRMRTIGFSGAGDMVSPEGPLLTSQDEFEPVFLAAARRTGMCDVRFEHEVTGFDITNDGTRVRVAILNRRESTRSTVHTRFLIAADGAASGIRNRLGIALSGRAAIGHYVNVHYTADLEPWVGHRRAVMFWVADGRARGVFQPLDGRGRWLCQIAYDGTPESLARFDANGCRAWIRTMIGDAQLAIDVHSIGTWTMSATVAQCFRQGPVFLVGDAAQQMPPTGGFGVNTGIQSAHNLAWKLAYVLDDRADPALLDTYESERLPVARQNTQRSLENSKVVVRVADAGEGVHPDGLSPREAVARTREYGNFLGMEFGCAYDSSTVTPDATPPPVVNNPISDYVACARPGHRLPHVWVTVASRRATTLDLIRRSITLIAFRDSPWRAPADALAGAEEINTVEIDYEPNVASTLGIEATGAVLVRPDGHVATRWHVAPQNPASVLDRAVNRLLGR